jgi:hypothetical protein
MWSVAETRFVQNPMRKYGVMRAAGENLNINSQKININTQKAKQETSSIDSKQPQEQKQWMH